MINKIYDLNITITEMETSEKCYRNLNSLYSCPIKINLYEQIIEMKNFKIN